MSAHDGSIDHHVFVVVITCQELENALETAILRPSTKAPVHDLPVAETRGQITPRNANSISVENGFDEQPIVRRTGIARRAAALHRSLTANGREGSFATDAIQRQCRSKSEKVSKRTFPAR